MDTGNGRMFRDEIRRAINRHSAENGSDTPDFILSEYLADCLEVWDRAVRAREKWYGRERKTVDAPASCVLHIAQTEPPPPDGDGGSHKKGSK
jgi:hypothetical protein